jgi:hypothetical protein
MNTWIRLTWGVVMLLGSLAGVGLTLPEWVAELGQSWQMTTALQQSQNQERQRMALLESRDEVVKKRVLAKHQIVDQLLAGELTLFEAAAWFGFLNDHPPEFPDPYRQKWPGASDEEKLCRQVLSWTGVALRQTLPPGQAEEKLRHLEQILAARLAHSGNVQLPEL